MKQWIAVLAVVVVIVVVYFVGQGHRAPVTAGDIASQTAPLAPAQDTSDGSSTAQSEDGITSDNSNIRMENGMKIEITKEGTGPAIVIGKTAVVEYEGKLTDGTIFDSTARHGGTPLEFPLGAGMVIKGWDQGVLGMKVGETRILTIPPELGYGASGTGGGAIPPNATLIFTVTLRGIK